MPLLNNPDSYFAGLLDGEGSFCGNRSGARIRPVVSCCMADRASVEALASRFGGKVRPTKRKNSNPRHSPTFQWEITGSRALDAVVDVYPWLITKRSIADHFLEFPVGVTSLRLSASKHMQRAVWFDELSRLNKRESVA